MRASRLINILTTLQARGLVTASELAAENEVAVRTIYRDIDALSASGVPVYAERGVEGGYRLLDGYKVRLNGLSTEEAQALFLSGLPGPASDLGLGAFISSAERKLTVALPEGLRDTADFMRGRFHFDAPGWYTDPEQPRHLRAVVEAVMQGHRVSMRYRSWKGERSRLVEPLGVVLKGGQWYMAARVDDSTRTYRVSRIIELTVTEDVFERPADFDLAAYWQDNTTRMEIETHPITIRLRLTTPGLAMLRHVCTNYMRERIIEETGPDAEGWRVVHMPAESIYPAASLVMRLGPDAEVLEPPELRARIIDWLGRLSRIYAGAG